MFATTQRIRSLMRERQITTKILAAHLQVSYSTMNNYLNGKRWMSIPQLRSVCQALDVSADYLLGLSPLINPLQIPQNEQAMLMLYRTLPDAGKDYALLQLRQLCGFCHKLHLRD